MLKMMTTKHMLSYQTFVSICCNTIYTLLSTLCVVNIHSAVENYEFDDNDEIQYLDEQQEESVSLSEISPSHYLRHQHGGTIVYANKNLNEEAKL